MRKDQVGIMIKSVAMLQTGWLLFMPGFGNGGTIPAARYWTDETNVVAAVSAYERSHILPNGEEIVTYGRDIDSMCTNYTAIIFAVVSPKKFKGKMFRIDALPIQEYDSPEGFLPLEYWPDKLYYFHFTPTPGQDGADDHFSPKDFLPTISDPHNVATLIGFPYYMSEKEAEEEKTRLNAKIAKFEAEKIDLEKRLNETAIPLRLQHMTVRTSMTFSGDEWGRWQTWRKIKARYNFVAGEIPDLKRKQENVEFQIQKLRDLKVDRKGEKMRVNEMHGPKQ